LAELVRENVKELIEGAVKPTQGDIRCIIFGHLARLAVWNLRGGWRGDDSAEEKLSRVGRWIKIIGGAESVIAALGSDFTSSSNCQSWTVQEASADPDELPF
jgi:hypothetical protein